jgi:CRISPR/Cas system CSM-associated protein Csm2 small subunit
MKILDEIDNVRWITKVIDSCTTFSQFQNAKKLAINWDRRVFDKSDNWSAKSRSNYYALTNMLAFSIDIKKNLLLNRI